MIVWLDQGNSRLKWALEDDVGIVSFGVEPNSSLEGLGVVLVSEKYDISEVWLCCVAGDLRVKQLRALVLASSGLELTVVRTQPRMAGLTFTYSPVESLGVDRYLQCVGAHSVGVGVIVLSFGTAITLDVVSPAGRHLGGHIVPGLRALCDVLHAKTANLMAVPDLLVSDVFLGESTESCLNLGLVAMLGSYLRGIVARFPMYRVVVCGGDAGVLVGLIDVECEMIDNLAIEGLRIVRENLVAG
ncbi:MAG: type III pantothenate kinase [Flavobacteriales bacterium]